ncbi:hypothetical protein [Aurantibacillus circumpalustris]|uniref:hypothetical protein n=1 Tax=Aurantibacillus circumpalustris TaxID=3036359 RepID=UPI00295BAF2A|nr:hypothetical protein [Aurantibacillus circumpalustris]
MKRFIILVISLFFRSVYGQGDVQDINKLLLNDSSSLRLLFTYPDSSRQVIFSACTYPSGFTQLSDVQKTTTSAFQKLALKYSQKRQEQLWEISRYPELAGILLDNKDKNKKELKLLLKMYSKDAQNASFYFVKHSEALIEMERIRQDFELRRNALIKEFPLNVREAFTLLLNDPEVFSLLLDDMNTTAMLGDFFVSNQKLLNHLADSVYVQTAKENGLEYEDWKKGIGKDTVMQKELKAVSKKYATGEDQADDVYGSSQKQNVTVILNTPPYPYWAGYPHWYSYPYWRPYPWWYDAGFYLDPFGSIIFIGMPSYRFGWWYYGHPHYYKRYVRTSHYFDWHYQSHPRSRGDFNRSVREYNHGAPRNAPRGASSGGGRRR